MYIFKKKKRVRFTKLEAETNYLHIVKLARRRVGIVQKGTHDNGCIRK